MYREQSHREHVEFRDPSRALSRKACADKRKEILAFPGDDVAYVGHLRETVLRKDRTASIGG